MDVYDIKTMIEEEVCVDIHRDFGGPKRVAEHLAKRFDALEEKIAYLEGKLERHEKRRVSTVDDVSDGYQKYQDGFDRGSNPYNNNDEWDLYQAWLDGYTDAGWDD
jgi:hypothetical protein